MTPREQSTLETILRSVAHYNQRSIVDIKHRELAVLDVGGRLVAGGTVIDAVTFGERLGRSA